MKEQDKLKSLADLIVSCEAQSGRLEGILLGDVGLAALWRSEMAILEAVASIGLEDVRISEGDLLIRISENRAGGADVRAIEDALAILRFLRSPGDPRHDPEGVLDRIWRQSMRSDAGAAEPMPSALELSDIFRQIDGRLPIWRALRVAADYARATGRRSPVAERLVFVAAEHAGRRLDRASRAGHDNDQDPLRGLGGRVGGSWVGLPSIGLTRGGFHIWSASSEKGIRDVLTGIDRTLETEIGRIISIRSWRSRCATACEGRHGRSRLRDALDLLALEPAMTSGLMMDRLGITRRGAIGLLEEMTASGLVREITMRRGARIWATPGLAALLRSDRSSRVMYRPSATDPGRLTPETRAPAERDPARPGHPLKQRNLREESRESIDRALADFDKVLASVDDILRKYKG